MHVLPHCSFQKFTLKTQVVSDNVMYIIFWFENGQNLSNFYINNEIKIGESTVNIVRLMLTYPMFEISDG